MTNKESSVFLFVKSKFTWCPINPNVKECWSWRRSFTAHFHEASVKATMLEDFLIALRNHHRAEKLEFVRDDAPSSSLIKKRAQQQQQKRSKAPPTPETSPPICPLRQESNEDLTSSSNPSNETTKTQTQRQNKESLQNFYDEVAPGVRRGSSGTKKKKSRKSFSSKGMIDRTLHMQREEAPHSDCVRNDEKLTMEQSSAKLPPPRESRWAARSA